MSAQLLNNPYVQSAAAGVAVYALLMFMKPAFMYTETGVLKRKSVNPLSVGLLVGLGWTAYTMLQKNKGVSEELAVAEMNAVNAAGANLAGNIRSTAQPGVSVGDTFYDQ